MENWKQIPSHPAYEASDYGRVRRSQAARGAKVGRIIAERRLPAGYAIVCLWENNRVATRLVHRLVCEAFFGPAPEGTEVNHKDSNKANNQPGNLEYVSRSTNLIHARDATGAYRGERNSQAKIDRATVLEIRRLHAEGMGYKRLAKHFGLTWGCVRSVATGQNWAHV